MKYFSKFLEIWFSKDWIQGSQRSGKPGNRAILSRIPWNWWFLANLGIPIFQNFLCWTQPWLVLQMMMKPTEISSTDLFKSDNGIFGIFENYFIKYCRFRSGVKKVHFHLDSALLSGKKGTFLTKTQGKYFWGTVGNPVDMTFRNTLFAFKMSLMVMISLKNWDEIHQMKYLDGFGLQSNLVYRLKFTD